jgi:creatinine amidohydrolase/Fe(II)-dependent formamide hydrolase-like protein
MAKSIHKWITTNVPTVFFEDNEVGRFKKKLWDASEKDIDKILEEYEVPSEPEVGKPNTYIQTTPRYRVIENRKKNDVVLIPVGCTENHGVHTVSALDSFMVTQIVEAVRRFTAKKGRMVNIALNPLNYGAHPYHHAGVPGTVIVDQNIVKEFLVYVMLGLWNDGFRKQIIVNNHGQFWVMETALHEFQHRYQLPGVFQVMDWHRAVREFWLPMDTEDTLDTSFFHADEAETSVALLLFPKGMVELKRAQRTEGKGYLPVGHFDDAVDGYRRPHRWSESEGHIPITVKGYPEGVIGNPQIADAKKAKRGIAAILKYLTLTIDHILDAFPPGEVPPVEEVTNRSAKEMEPYLKEPLSKGWKSVYGLKRVGM